MPSQAHIRYTSKVFSTHPRRKQLIQRYIHMPMRGHTVNSQKNLNAPVMINSLPVGKGMTEFFRGRRLAKRIEKITVGQLDLNDFDVSLYT